MKRSIQILYRCLKWTLSIFFLLVVLYLISAVVLSVIPVNRHINSRHEADIYILSNGVHLDIVLPLRNEIKNWTSDIWIDDKIAPTAKFISFGWGDKLFFLNTPEWSDLTVKTTFVALFLKSPSAIHIDYYTDMQIGDKCRKIPVDSEQYKSVVDYIEKSFKKDSSGKKIQIQGLQYYSYDCFYEATNSYSLFFTCNTWTNKCLKESGLKACLWTPFDRGTLYHYRK